MKPKKSYLPLDEQKPFSDAIFGELNVLFLIASLSTENTSQNPLHNNYKDLTTFIEFLF